jgi:uncharacterized small protein (DUF1192 family)
MDRKASNQSLAGYKGSPGLSEHRKGFYARQFDAQEIRDLELVSTSGLDDEIAMLRVLLRRYYAEVISVEDTRMIGEAIDRVSRAASCLGRLVSAQNSRAGRQQNKYEQAMQEALERFAKDKDLHL